MTIITEPSFVSDAASGCMPDCCVMDCSFCGADGDGACMVDVW